jgi:hypothetical protein
VVVVDGLIKAGVVLDSSSNGATVPKLDEGSPTEDDHVEGKDRCRRDDHEVDHRISSTHRLVTTRPATNSRMEARIVLRRVLLIEQLVDPATVPFQECLALRLASPLVVPLPIVRVRRPPGPESRPAGTPARANDRHGSQGQSKCSGLIASLRRRPDLRLLRDAALAADAELDEVALEVAAHDLLAVVVARLQAAEVSALGEGVWVG